MSAWIAYALAVSALAGTAAMASEQVARMSGVATRWTWIAALTATALAPLAIWIGGGRAAPARASDGYDQGGSAVIGDLAVVGGSAAGTGIDTLLLVAVSGATVIALIAIVASAARLTLRRRRWRRGRMDGELVLVSRDTGPAVVGVVRGEIVVPAWVFSLDPADRACLLAHERSHLRAGDPRLSAAALALAALAAWNPVAWWQLRRLRLAIELDCDARVLRELGDRRAYGRALLAVGGMRSRRPQPLMAFAERTRDLERRILVMSETRPRRLRRGVLAAVASFAVMAACAVPRPDAPTPALPFAASSWPGESRPSGHPSPAPAVTPVRPVSSAANSPAPAAPPPLPTDTPVVAVGERPTFTPRTREPELPADQRRVLMEYLELNYPQALRDAGVGGRTTLWVFIDEQGRTGNTRIVESSGYPAFDDLAQRALRTVSWHPAMNRDARVPVWIQLPIVYHARRDPAAARETRPAEPRTAGDPRLLNRDEVVSAATRAAGGAHGRAEVWISVDVDGTVDQVRLAEGSGIDAVDRAALEAAAMARFEPARRGGEAVPTWIRFPIVLQPARE